MGTWYEHQFLQGQPVGVSFADVPLDAMLHSAARCSAASARAKAKQLNVHVVSPCCMQDLHVPADVVSCQRLSPRSLGLH